MIFGDDEYLYYAASKEVNDEKKTQRMYLFRMDMSGLKKEEICPFDDGDWHSTYIAKATKDFAGNLYFFDVDSRPEMVYIYTPEGWGKDFTPKWPLVRSWG